MASEKNLQELFHETLKDIYFAEKKILSALPKMAKAAQSQELKAAFEKHESETEEHVARLEKVFEEIDQTPRGKTCDAIMGIIEEGQEVMKEFRGAPALDAGLLAAAQAVEHYEIARYGTLKVWNRLWLELLVIWRVRTPIGDANAKPLFCVVVSSGPIWVADAECNGASIDAVDGRERVCSLRGAS
jgi:ferritin-like metal-binding protein YciE